MNLHLRIHLSTGRLGILLVLPALLVAACGDTGDTGDAEAEARIELGRSVFTELAQPTCATCHALEDAGATSRVGPNLDELRPDMQRVVAAVTNGVGIMPAQENTLTEEQIQAVAYYVARVTGSVD